MAQAKTSLKNKNCEPALKSLDELSTPDGTDRLAFLMEYGSALQICNQPEKSNQIFSTAEKLADEIDYVSVSQVASATFMNEGFISYKGDSFEKLFLNASKALNYLDLNKPDEALIEVRRMNEKFSKLKNENRKNHELNSFAKYLSGLIWESTGQYDDACIDYKDAFLTTLKNTSETEIKHLGYQMLKSCWQADRKEDFKQLSKKVNLTSFEIDSIKNEKTKSEFVLLFLKGWGPQKLENPLHSTFPYLVKASLQTQFLKTELFDEQSKHLGTYFSQPIYSVSAAAQLSLESDQAPLLARRIAARVAKQVAADQIRQKDAALGFAALIFMVGSERADLRQWSFLPDAIHSLRINLKPGRYSAKITGVNENKVTTEEFENLSFEINKKQKFIKSYRSLQ